MYFFSKYFLTQLKITTMNEKKHGGKRNGSGRKKMKLKDKKVRLTIWPTGEAVKNAGGKEKAKILALNALDLA